MIATERTVQRIDIVRADVDLAVVCARIEIGVQEKVQSKPVALRDEVLGIVPGHCEAELVHVVAPHSDPVAHGQLGDEGGKQEEVSDAKMASGSTRETAHLRRGE